MYSYSIVRARYYFVVENKNCLLRILVFNFFPNPNLIVLVIVLIVVVIKARVYHDMVLIYLTFA